MPYLAAKFYEILKFSRLFRIKISFKISGVVLNLKRGGSSFARRAVKFYAEDRLIYRVLVDMRSR